MTSFLNISHKGLGRAITMLLLCMGLVSCGNSHNKDNSGRITDKAGLQNSLSAIIKEQPGKVRFAHRPGSGYTNSRGEVVAVNDGGYVALPDGNGYSIAVFIKDFGGSQEEAEKIIAMISATIYSHLTNNADN